MTLLNRFALCVCAGLLVSLLASPLSAQLSTEMKLLYEDLIEIFDGDLKLKLQQALENGEGFIELTPQQFKRFRDHPDNPLDGWDQIDPEQVGGLIHLAFETEPVRSRAPGYLERQHKLLLQKFQATIADAARSTVRILDGRRQLALGTIVTSQGHVVTKLSEIREATALICQLHDGRIFPAQLAAEDSTNDIAVLQIAADQLTPIAWAESQPEPGAFVVTCGNSASPLAIGVYSHAPRSLVGKNQAFLGVEPQTVAEGILVVTITPDSSAEKAGLEANDIITRLNGNRVSTVEELVNAIRALQPGDKLDIEFVRDKLTAETQATLAGRDLSGPHAQRFQKMNKYGAIPSQRASEFPVVFQHDTPLLPEQCGGPIVDLDGRAVGINIARGGRVASYAIPADHLQSLVQQMLRATVAEKPDDEETDRK